MVLAAVVQGSARADQPKADQPLAGKSQVKGKSQKHLSACTFDRALFFRRHFNNFLVFNLNQ